ncbi:MAG: Uma2 family endonuclease [Actinomycetes bacterium]
MSVPAQLDRFTVQDLEHVPDDGMRYEVINGSLFVTAPAGYPHNARAQLVGLALLRAAPETLEVLMTGTQAVELDDGDGPCPDVLVFRSGSYSGAVPGSAVHLVVEVTSPSNRSNDTVVKLERYARAGIEHYWIVDPDQITVYTLEPGTHRYRETERGSSVTASEPFDVTVSLPV